MLAEGLMSVIPLAGAEPRKRKKTKQTGPVTEVIANVNDGGVPIGESHPNCRYLDKEVEQVRQFRAEGYTLAQLSRMMDMPIRTIRDYIAGTRRQQSVAGWKKIKRHLRYGSSAL